MSHIENDFKNITEYCSSNEECLFYDFALSYDYFTFIYRKGIVVKEYLCQVSRETYPVGSLVTVTHKTPVSKTESIQSNDRLPDLLTKLAKDLDFKFKMGQPVGKVEANRSSSGDESSSGDDSDNYEEYYASEDEDHEHLYKMDASLERDLAQVLDVFGKNAIKLTSLESIDSIDIMFLVPLDFLHEEIARAWKLVKKEPLCVKVTFSLSRYLDGHKPTVKVTQESQKKFGIGGQLEKILETFFSQHWPQLSNAMVKNENVSLEPLRRYQEASGDSSGSSFEEKSVLPRALKSEVNVDDKMLADIKRMGFSEYMARNALILTRNSINEAVNLLVSSPDQCMEEPVDHSLSASTSGAASALPKPSIKVPAIKRTKAPKGSAKIPAVAGSGFYNDVTRLMSMLIPSFLTTAADPKSVPSLEHGFLVQLMHYIRQRVPTLNEYCVICDVRHVFQNGAMLKPAVCAGQLCVFAFQTLGVMSDAADDIATDASVVDLLIVMAKAACHSKRNDLIFDPYPTVCHPKSPKELAFNPQKKDFKKCHDVLSLFPITEKMVSCDAVKLKEMMDAKSELAYPLLQWIINSNRSHIVKLPKQKQLGFMNTPHQFLLMSSPPAKEAAFRNAKAKYGSVFAFHGSQLENWHSIMREGLINASGTKYQVNGAAHGKGIYLSPQASMSFNYSGGFRRAAKVQPPKGGIGDREKDTTRQFLNNMDTGICIALCEVVKSAELTDKGSIWVLKNEEHVCTRFFFVYEKGVHTSEDINTTHANVKAEIEKAVCFNYR